MKLAIALRGNNLTEKLDDRFGRSKYFCIYDLNSKTAGFVENKHATEQDGVGKHVIDLLVDQNVEMIIACDFGRKVRTTLEKKKIQMVIVHNVSLTGEEVLNKILEN
ncbi:MAG: hypothetical protein K8R74_02250 [Bacteroidales bacterium]|nr:hypothetical protein [Bacteroidales bacterium]